MRKTVSAVLAAFIMLTALLPVLTVPAAADDLPTFSLAVDKTEVHPKQTITVSVNLKNTDACLYGIATLQAALIYQPEYLTVYESNIKVNKIISSLGMDVRTFLNPRNLNNLIEVWVYPKMDESIPGNTANIFTVTFTVKEDVPSGTELQFRFGDAELFVLTTWKEDKTDATELDTLQEGPVTATVGKMLSEDATLKSLSVDGYELNREFAANQTSYAIAVPYEVKSVSVNYQTASEFASAKLSGNTKLAVGTNAVKIAVTAEDGVTKKTYSITVTRQPAPEEESSVVSEPSDVSEPSSDVSDPSETESSQTPSEPESSEPVSEPTSSQDERDDSYVEAMQRQIDDLKNENVGLKDRETAVVIIFSVISALLLAALIIVSVNYKKDIR